MSDPVVVKGENWFVRGWIGFWKWVGEIFLNLWAFVTTEGKTVKEWKLDPLKILAITCFVAAIWIAVKAVGLAEGGKDASIVGAIAGLAGLVGGFGSFLFNQANSNDASIRSQGNGS